MDCASQQILEQCPIQATQLLTKPVACGQGLLDIEAIRLSEIKDQGKTEFDHQQGMFD